MAVESTQITRMYHRIHQWSFPWLLQRDSHKLYNVHMISAIERLLETSFTSTSHSYLHVDRYSRVRSDYCGYFILRVFILSYKHADDTTRHADATTRHDPRQYLYMHTHIYKYAHTHAHAYMQVGLLSSHRRQFWRFGVMTLIFWGGVVEGGRGASMKYYHIL